MSAAALRVEKSTFTKQWKRYIKINFQKELEEICLHFEIIVGFALKFV